ncbi:MAG: hypothetical protein M1828_006658 [Chrysothrix sp. TS-e1954]|nr:MAG: hypothetical protein M1828_006658 [Chrysothrix sp. TS-e1954]
MPYPTHAEGFMVTDTKKWSEFTKQEFQLKPFEDRDIDIAIDACGVCGSDVHTITGGWGETPLPLCVGHEVIGRAIKVGKGVTTVQVGDRVGVGAQIQADLTCGNCKADQENYCPNMVDTYGAPYKDGTISQGGYASHIRAHEYFTFKIPDNIETSIAAPMLCAGITVYSPLVRLGCGPGKRVGVVGIGGLGHFAVLFAAALGAEVYALSHTPSKKDDALKLGAKHFVCTKDKDWEKPLAFTLDFILNCADATDKFDLGQYFSTMKVMGRFHNVGLPDQPLPEMKAQIFAPGGYYIGASHIGNRPEMLEMLDLASKQNIESWVTPIDISEKGCKEVVERVYKNDKQAQKRLADFRYDFLPLLRNKTSARIYKFVHARLPKTKHRLVPNDQPISLIARLRRRGSLLRLRNRSRNDKAGLSESMSTREVRNGMASWQDAEASNVGGREPGARRKKLAGYFRAANELRQTYQQSAMQSMANREAAFDTQELPGAFPGAVVTQNGEEQMVIFPSYARRHVKTRPQAVPGTIQESTGAGRDARDTTGSGDAEFWRQQWDQYEDDNAIVDVDVRGWLYAPHRGPMTRRHRLAVGLARQMVGLPAPTGKSPSNSPDNSRSSSPHGLRDRLESHSQKREEELAQREAESIVQRGEAEAQVASTGAYSEEPYSKKSRSATSSRSASRSSSPDGLRSASHQLASSNGRPVRSEQMDHSQVHKRASWNSPSQMTATEQAAANMHLMTRLKPFLANPLTNTPISAFFYNDERSIQKTTDTNSAGHFSFRAALDFVPTGVRILASENLSATEEVLIIEPHGVSVISDIDDTIKHSAIGSGPKEIFQNVFIRDLRDLTVPGVEKWYHRLANQGVTFHYVSNSPWQLFPLLTDFFSQANLPPGSFHLKQYSGMFQGIFEPVAERKKSTLDKIMIDFPTRRYILVGDSGEADLEVYTDVVLENPGRVLGIFIRDVTTPAQKGFFDSAMGPLSGESHAGKTSGPRMQTKSSSSSMSDGKKADVDLEMAKARSLREFHETEKHSDGTDAKSERPKLPPRRPTAPSALEENLIDIDFDDTKPLQKKQSEPSAVAGSKLQPPPRPAKPRSLSSASEGEHPNLRANKSPPPLPRKPSSAVKVGEADDTGASSITASTGSTKPAKPRRPDPPPPRQTYRSAARQKLSSAYNALPPLHNQQPQASSSSSSRGGSPLRESYTSGDQDGVGTGVPPPMPPRKAGSFPASMLTSNPSSSASYPNSTSASASAPLNKKEELWKRRWARAKAILDGKGVVLRSWRVGSDGEAEAMRLIEKAQREESSGS